MMLYIDDKNKKNITVKSLTEVTELLFKGGIVDAESIIERIKRDYDIYQEDETYIKNMVKILSDDELKKISKQMHFDEEKFSEDIGLFTNNFDLAKKFVAKHPLFYTKEKLWWLWSNINKRWVIVDEIDVMNEIDKALKEVYDTTKTQKKNEIIESLKRVGRKNVPKKIKNTWIQFNDKIIDVETNEEFKSTPDFFSTNPIPHNIGKTEDTPNIDRLIKDWVGEEWVLTIYQIIAYCMLPSYPIHRIFCLNGSGLNGKGTLLRLINNFIGSGNICSTELDQIIKSNFETAKLYKKLVCEMGETNFSAIEKTSLLKRLTGQDMIGFEFKNKNPFDDFNYAKIIIATNSLPMTYDKTIGFYRRWFIIDFPNIFNEKNDVLKCITEEEYENLAKKCIRILKELLEKREFHNEGSIQEREKRFEEISNPIKPFIKEIFEKNFNSKYPLYEFRDKFWGYLSQRNMRRMTKSEISDAIKNEGYSIEKGHYYKSDGMESTMYFVVGLKEKEKKEDIKEKSDIFDNKDILFNINSLYGKQISYNISNVSKISADNETIKKAKEFIKLFGKCPKEDFEKEFGQETATFLLENDCGIVKITDHYELVECS